MAVENNVGMDWSLAANADLSAKQFYFLLVTSGGKADLCTGAASEGFFGVLQNDPTANQAAEIRYGGISKVVCGGSFNPGDFVTSDSNGKAVKYTKGTVFTGTPYIVSGSSVYGLALSAGVSGQRASIVVQPQGLHN
jgi:hypothetical protein